MLLTHGPLAPLGITPSSELVKVLAEATLALVLFSDASRVGLHQLRADLGLCLRLLGIGLPLAIGLGTLLAFILPGVSDIWLALLIGAALAPTDAALGAAVMVNRAVPARIRRLDVAALARQAVADGADLLGVAGGDGTQALVAGIAAEHGLPFLVISAGTRNHFGLDLGLDREDPATCLDALTDGEELRVDLGVIADRTFVNNASFGAYAEVVRSPAYRDDSGALPCRCCPACSRATRGRGCPPGPVPPGSRARRPCWSATARMR